MSDEKSPLLGFYWDRDMADFTNPDDVNRLSEFGEISIANIVLDNLFEDGIITRNPEVGQIDVATGRVTCPVLNEPIMGIIHGMGFVMTVGLEANEVLDSATTLTLMDAALTDEEDFWERAFVIFTSGACDGEVREVTSYNAITKTLGWDNVLPFVPAPGDTYTVTFYYVQDYTAGVWNWVYGKTLTNTPRDGIIQWVAKAASDKLASEILIAKVLLTGAGAVSAMDHTPDADDFDRNLWYGAGAVDRITCCGTFPVPDVGIDLEVLHPHLILRGPVEITWDNVNCCVTVVEWHKRDRTKIRVENDGTAVGNISYTMTIWGRKERYG